MSYQVRAGALNQSVVLENATSSADGDGGFTISYAALTPSPVWASIVPATPALMERVIASTVQASTSHIVEMRYHSGVTTKTRITFGGNRYLYVRGVQNVDEADEVTRLTCDEVIA